MSRRYRRIAWTAALVLLAACAGDTAEPVATGNPPRADPTAIPPSPRLALVLSSGGPRGFAHIGVLKVLVAWRHERFLIRFVFDPELQKDTTKFSILRL